MTEPTYSREQIKQAILKEMADAGLLTENKEKFYEVWGLVVEALNNFDNKLKPARMGEIIYDKRPS